MSHQATGEAFPLRGDFFEATYLPGPSSPSIRQEEW